MVTCFIPLIALKSKSTNVSGGQGPEISKLVAYTRLQSDTPSDFQLVSKIPTTEHMPRVRGSALGLACRKKVTMTKRSTERTPRIEGPKP